MSNPTEAIKNLPNGQAVLDMVRGKDPEQVFYDECKRRNIDPNTILSQLK